MRLNSRHLSAAAVILGIFLFFLAEILSAGVNNVLFLENHVGQDHTEATIGATIRRIGDYDLVIVTRQPKKQRGGYETYVWLKYATLSDDEKRIANTLDR